MHLQSLVDEPPEAWVELLRPPEDLPQLLRNQYVLHPDATATMDGDDVWRSMLLSPHINAVVRNPETNMIDAANVCHKCHTKLSNDATMPQFAIANGLYMGRADDPALGFPGDLTPQEWRIMSLVIGRFNVSRVWFEQSADTNRNGIRGQSISCEAPLDEISEYTKVPRPHFGVGHVHISGHTTSTQKAKAIKPILIRREKVNTCPSSSKL